jgi:replicative DNA helicase
MNALSPGYDQSDLINYDAEQAYLGACLANNEVWHLLAAELHPEHFADVLHGRIYDAVGKLITAGIRADVITLKKQFDQDEALKSIGGAEYLVDLARHVVTVLHADDYGRQVIDLWRRRNVVEAAHQAIAAATRFAPNHAAGDVIEHLEERLADIASSGTEARPAVTASQAMQGSLERADAALRGERSAGGLQTGLADLDKKLGGLMGGDLITVAGRPGMGKTVLALTIGRNVALAGGQVLFFSLEMSADQLGDRLQAMETGIEVDRQRRGGVGMDEISVMMEAAAAMHGKGLVIEDEPQITAAIIQTKARRMQRKRGLSVVILDYLQLVRADRANARASLYEIVTELSKTMKSMAKRLNVPVIMLSQLSREVEKRDDKRPQLADLRDSGSIEQDSDLVLFPFREEYYLERSEPKPRDDEDPSSDKFTRRVTAWQSRLDQAKNLALIGIAKNRHGRTGEVRLRFSGPRQRFENLQQEAHYHGQD